MRRSAFTAGRRRGFGSRADRARITGLTPYDTSGTLGSHPLRRSQTSYRERNMSQLSERGAQFIGHFEGWVPAAYNDPTNNATIGYGHLIHMVPVTAHDKSEWGTLSPAAGIH